MLLVFDCVLHGCIVCLIFDSVSPDVIVLLIFDCVLHGFYRVVGIRLCSAWVRFVGIRLCIAWVV